MNQKLYNTFYMNMRYESQKLYGFSQQQFDIQRTQDIFPDVMTTMAANDHVAYVKAEGSWRDHYSTKSGEALDIGSPSVWIAKIKSAFRLALKM